MELYVIDRQVGFGLAHSTLLWLPSEVHQDKRALRRMAQGRITLRLDKRRCLSSYEL